MKTRTLVDYWCVPIVYYHILEECPKKETFSIGEGGLRARVVYENEEQCVYATRIEIFGAQEVWDRETPQQWIQDILRNTSPQDIEAMYI